MFNLRSDLYGSPIKLDNLMSVEECNFLIEKVTSELFLVDATVERSKGEKDNTVRDSEVVFLPFNDDYLPLYNKIANCIVDINNKWFNYDLLVCSPIQFTKYDDKTSGFYAPHRDTVEGQFGTVRKLSFSIQLSDPNSYEGGDLVYYDTTIHKTSMQRDQGCINLFPSYSIHEVTPVTKGTRYSLVGWVSGPPFK
jgi:PKHD-type hydroxylase